MKLDIQGTTVTVEATPEEIETILKSMGQKYSSVKIEGCTVYLDGKPLPFEEVSKVLERGGVRAECRGGTYIITVTAMVNAVPGGGL